MPPHHVTLSPAFPTETIRGEVEVGETDMVCIDNTEINSVEINSATAGRTLVARVLVIDDEQLLGQTIQLGLEDAMEVELETSGESGLKRVLSDSTINLVLCDLSLPDLSGIDIYREVAIQRPDLIERFVIMTGGAVSKASRDFLESYRGPLLNKPFTITQVEGLVQSLLDAAAN